ncbi:transcription antitermination factor NusB [Pedobacter puniceum]|jgi:N utilization substance protein B|uniref:Transcription antitermination factor NusB n=1 Tax=Pedobacter puniceum TaxID=2666136 RepID=A0A7K0FJB5_9SPHI|nr:transcription antitermination factor NusB [Pedobacter puniceum]MRX46069.1 transcription antitermination factor NusB [Pedobacter puniceum]
MLNRRHLRVKVMQTLYAFQQTESTDYRLQEKNLLASVDKVYEMYISLLALINDVVQYADIDAIERANKHLPSEEDLNPNLKILNNLFIKLLLASEEYQQAIKKYKTSWDFDPELARSLFASLKASAEYQDYIKTEGQDLHTDKDIIKFIFKKVILKSSLAQSALEEKHINWQVDQDVLQAMIAKTLKNFSSLEGDHKLAQISSNWSEDKEFITDLFHKTVANESTFQELIAGKTKNWEADRIAMMDVIIMKMAIAEMIYFSSIPVKVTINEYLEIAKEFSTPKSNSFINGILDKIFEELNAQNKIRKYGRGLN